MEAQKICEQFPKQMTRNLADLDFCISCVASFTKDWTKKHLHSRRNLEYRIAHPDDILLLGIAYNELSFMYNEEAKYKEAIEAGKRSSEVYLCMDLYSKKQNMAMYPMLNCANAHIFMGEANQAETYVQPCLEWLEGSEYQWNFNANRCSSSIFLLGIFYLLTY